MTTATLLTVVGSVVCVKTLAFVWFTMRRGRRQRAALVVAGSAARAAGAAASVRVPDDPSAWRLQWSEPGVMLVENTSGLAAARDVELSATLTAGSGVAASVEQAERFVGTGACFTARFAAVDSWLAACTLSYSVVWRTPEGERRRQARTAQPVVPVPDLGLGLA